MVSDACEATETTMNDCVVAKTIAVNIPEGSSEVGTKAFAVNPGLISTLLRNTPSAWPAEFCTVTHTDAEIDWEYVFVYDACILRRIVLDPPSCYVDPARYPDVFLF